MPVYKPRWSTRRSGTRPWRHVWSGWRRQQRVRQRWPIGNETGEVSPRPDLAAGPTSTAPMLAQPVDAQCTLGVLSPDSEEWDVHGGTLREDHYDEKVAYCRDDCPRIDNGRATPVSASRRPVCHGRCACGLV